MASLITYMDPHTLEAMAGSDPDLAEKWYGRGWGHGAEEYWPQEEDTYSPPPRKLLALVGVEDRALLDLHLLQHISTRRLAILLHISQPSVVWRIKRALGRLKLAYDRPPAPDLSHLTDRTPEKLKEALIAVADRKTILSAAIYLGIPAHSLRRRVSFALTYLSVQDRVFYEYLLAREPKHQMATRIYKTGKGGK